MKVFIQIISLSFISILLHSFVQIIVLKLIDWPNIEQFRPLTIILTMILYLIFSNFIFNRNNENQNFILSFSILFVIQVTTIISLVGIQIINLLTNPQPGFAPDTAAIATGFDFSDLMFKILIFAIVLPLLVLMSFRLFRKATRINVN